MLKRSEREQRDGLKSIDLLTRENNELLTAWGRQILLRDYGNRKYIFDQFTIPLKEYILGKMAEFAEDPEGCGISEEELRDLDFCYWNMVLFEARFRQFDSFCLYMERDRDPADRFYQPRRKCLLKIGVIQAIQRLLDDEIDILAISLPPGTGKTTLEKFLNAGVAGWFPKDFNLFYSHSGDIDRMYYDGVYQMVADPDYRWKEIFPYLKVTGTNAKMLQFNVGKYKPFPSVQCTSIDSKNAGKVRCSKFLFVDDMIGGIEEALNKNILDKLWTKYSVDALQRKIDGCKEVHIATRWSVFDVIGRLQTVYEGNPRAVFIAVPDIDPETGESNFMYEYGGFSTEFFNRQALIMDEISYRCLYKNEPVEREGLLYHEDDLRRFMQLPEDEPDAILSICDTKTTGSDFMFFPVMYQYGDDFYLADCICDNNSDFEMQYTRLANIICQHNVQQAEFESNAGGSRVAVEVSDRVNAQGGRCHITSRMTKTNKETRIIVNSDWVKKHVLFLDKEKYAMQSDYGRMMSFLLGYTVTGKNAHDDVPDGLANFSLFVTRKNNIKPTMIIQSPF